MALDTAAMRKKWQGGVWHREAIQGDLFAALDEIDRLRRVEEERNTTIIQLRSDARKHELYYPHVCVVNHTHRVIADPERAVTVFRQNSVRARIDTSEGPISMMSTAGVEMTIRAGRLLVVEPEAASEFAVRPDPPCVQKAILVWESTEPLGHYATTTRLAWALHEKNLCRCCTP